MKLRAWFLATTVMMLCSCNTARSYSGYLIIKSNTEYRTQKQEPTCLYPQCEVIVYTIKYKGHTIRALCQSYDYQNKCRELEVGKSYDFKRSKEFGDFLSLDQMHATLGVESEEQE